MKNGIKRTTIHKTISNIKFNDQVYALYKKQKKPPNLTSGEFLKNWLPLEKRKGQFITSRGKELYQKHRELLLKVEKKYKVDGKIIVALWGIETEYGDFVGNFNVTEALATLAYKSRRKKFFTRELLSALKIIDRGHVNPDEMLGSWAGAIGQCQFMPTNFFVFAQDFDNDGKKDIWNSLPDIFSSIANYLKKNRWHLKKPIGHQIKLPARKSKKSILGKWKKNRIWNKRGITLMNGTPIPYPQFQSKIIKLKFNDQRYMAIHHNFNVILRWNRSNIFAFKAIYLMNYFNGTHYPWT